MGEKTEDYSPKFFNIIMLFWKKEAVILLLQKQQKSTKNAVRRQYLNIFRE